MPIEAKKSKVRRKVVIVFITSISFACCLLFLLVPRQPADMRGVDRSNASICIIRSSQSKDNGINLYPTPTELINRYSKIVETELGKYPAGIFENGAPCQVHICGSVDIEGVAVGGTYDEGGVYVGVAYRDDGLPISEYAFCLCLHAELSSMLLNKNAVDKQAVFAEFARCNGRSNYRGSGLDFVKSRATYDWNDRPKWYSLGFVSAYAASSAEEDVNEMAGLMFADKITFIGACQSNSTILCKAAHLIQWYKNLRVSCPVEIVDGRVEITN